MSDSKSDVIFLTNVRLSFPHLVDPQVKKNEETGAERTSYNAELLMPPDHPGAAEFMKTVGRMALDKWAEHANTILSMLQNDRKQRCYGKGDERLHKKTLVPYDGHAGMFYITAGRERKPQMIQPSGKPIDSNDSLAYRALASEMYAGCRVNVAIKPWLQDNKHGRGVRCDLVAIQFAGHDAPFGEGAIDASPMFGAVSVPQTAQPEPSMPLPPFMLGQ